MEWEYIKTIEHGFMRNRECIKRMKIIGGWLVKYIDYAGSKGPARHAMIYVPDCEESWDVTKEPIKLEQFVLKKNSNYNERTCRVEVPGGWVVLDGHYLAGKEQSHVSLVYVPDPNHQWEIKEPEKESAI